MQLTQRQVPEEFLHALPEGIKFVNKHGKDFLIVEVLNCVQGHSLMSESVRIHGEPSIRIEVAVGESRGMVFLDAFWGGHDKLYGFIPRIAGDAPMDARVYCPSCGVDMTVDRPCNHERCDAQRAILFALPGGRNRIYACARLGCPGHHMEILDVPSRVTESVDDINFFGSSQDDHFQGI